jgi:hypothetical protein
VTATKIIIVSVLAYIALFFIAYILILNTKFTGDAAGRGMASGLTFIFGLGILFIIAVILTSVLIYLSSSAPSWVRLIAFIPILLPTFFFLKDFFGLSMPNEQAFEEQAYRLTIELKSDFNLENATFTFRSSKGSSSSKLHTIKEEGGFYFYEKNNAIYSEEERKFYVHSKDFETEESFLIISYKPEEIPFTDWKALPGIKNNVEDSVILEFRYTITK